MDSATPTTPLLSLRLSFGSILKPFLFLRFSLTCKRWSVSPSGQAMQCLILLSMFLMHSMQPPVLRLHYFKCLVGKNIFTAPHVRTWYAAVFTPWRPTSSAWNERAFVRMLLEATHFQAWLGDCCKRFDLVELIGPRACVFGGTLLFFACLFSIFHHGDSHAAADYCRGS